MKADEKPLFVVNPRSGGGRTGKLFESLRAPIEKIVGPIDVAFTEGPRHASDIAEQAAMNDRKTVVAVGGDGSIHEVTCGLMTARERGKSDTILGVLGQGTGGDFRRTLGLEHRLDAYCRAIAGGRSREVDVGRFSYRAFDGSEKTAYFINILSAGMGGLVDRYVAQMGRHVGGTLAYFGASLRGLIESEVGKLKCTVTSGGEERVEHIATRNIAICNGQYFGSGMHVAPMADPFDGRFEVVSLGDAPKLKFALASSRIYTGAHLKSPDVVHFSCEKITIELTNTSIDDRFLLDVDGEPLGKLPITIDTVPKALRVLMP